MEYFVRRFSDIFQLLKSIDQIAIWYQLYGQLFWIAFPYLKRVPLDGNVIGKHVEQLSENNNTIVTQNITNWH